MSRRKALAGSLAILLLGSPPCAINASPASSPMRLLVRQGDPVPGVGLVTRIDNVTINNAGEWLVEADTDADASSDEVMLRGSGLYLRENQTLEHPPGATISSFDSVNLNSAGHSGWNFFLRNQPSNADSGVYFDTGLLIQENDLSIAPQLSPNARYSGFLDVKVNDADQIAVVATIDDPLIPTTIDRALVIVGLDGSGHLLSEKALAKEGQILPGQTQAIADFGTGPHQSAFNNLGQLLYFADLTGIFLTDGVIYRDLTRIAQEGSPSPVAGRNYEILAGYGLDMNSLGEIVFRANLDGDPTSDEDIIVEDEELVHTREILPATSPFILTDLGPADGPVAIDEDRNVLWYGHWNNPDPAKDRGLFLNRVPIAQKGEPVGGLTVDTFATGPNAFAMSRNGRYIVFRGVLSDKTEAAVLLEVQAPPPVPDGDHVPGIPMKAVKNPNGADIDVTWDATSCAASRYNLFYGDLASVGNLAYTGAACDLGVMGEATFTPPEGSVFFLIASANESGVEGGHGYDSEGRARHAGAAGLCGVLGQIRSARCSPPTLSP